MNHIIIPCLNGLELTKKCIASCLKQTIPVEIFVIDSGSTDGTAPWLWHADGIDHTILSGYSVSECWNFGIRLAFKDSDHCLVINNDTELRPDTYERLLEHGGEFVTGVGVSGWSGRRDDGQPSESLHPHFSCFLIRKSCWDKVGSFDESYYPAYCEDTDYHVRMHRAGVRAVSIDVPFLHHSSSTLKHMTEFELRKARQQINVNREIFRTKYGCVPGTPEYDALFTSEVVAAPSDTNGSPIVSHHARQASILPEPDRPHVPSP